jgi:hypothetical protein
MDVDPQGIEPGEDWRAELIRQMSAAEAVLACGSPDFLASPYCQEEIEQAKREGKPIYPVLVRRLNPGQSLEEIGIHQQYVDLTANYDAELKRLTSVLPRAAFPTGLLVQTALRAAAVLAVTVLLFAGVALAVRAINPPVVLPTEVVLPTDTPSLDGYDLKVVVAPFALDASLSEADRRLADDLSLRLSRDMERRIQALDGQNNVEIGFLGADQIPPLVETALSQAADNRDQTLLQSAAAMADNRNFDMVFYGLVSRGDDGLLVIAPRLYIPPERFSEALEMTGAQSFGADIVLTNTSMDTAYQTSTELQGRVAALVQVIRGISAYITRNYDETLRAFVAAEDVPNWTQGRETLYLLQGNVYLQLARDAITNCNRDRVLQQLGLAEGEYQRALADEDSGPIARPQAALAEVFMLRSTWSLVDESNPCEPQQIDLDDIERALEYSEGATAAEDFAQLDPALQAAVIFTKARAQATLWYAVDLNDPLFDQYAEVIESETAEIFALYENSPDNLVLIKTAFEAYYLRGTIHADYSGECGDSTLEDYRAALAIADASRSAVERSRQMFVMGALGECYELVGETDQAIAQYRAAYDIARTLATGTQDRDLYGCKIRLLTGDRNAAAVTSDCE